MSLVNVWITPAKAMVVVDTEGQSDEGEYLEVSKLLTIPHANVVVAVRGQNVFLNGLTSLLLQMRDTGSFDAIEGVMSDALARTTQYLAANCQDAKGSVYKQEVTIVGYSRSRGSVACVVFQSTDEQGFSTQEIDDVYLSPWDDAWGRDGLHAKSPEQARVISTEQVSRALEMHADAPFGGRLLLAEVTRDDLRLSSLGRVTSRAST